MCPAGKSPILFIGRFIFPPHPNETGIRCGYHFFSYTSNLHTIPVKQANLIMGQDDKQDTLEQIVAFQMQRAEVMGHIAGWIAHDLDNLLTQTLVQALLALVKLEADNPAQPHLIRAAKTAEQAATITCRLLAYAKSRAIQTIPINLNDLVTQSVLTFHAWPFPDISLRVDLASDLPPVLGDCCQLWQVVINLLINAAEACEGGAGQITVQTSLVTLPAGMADKLFAGHAAPAPGDYIRLSVRDTGVGIDPQTLALIFQPYFSTKLWGRGLGLAILLEIVKKHHGGVQVHSKPGQGTTFLVYLPAHTPHTPAEYTAETAGVQTTRPGTTRPPHPKLDNGGI